MNKELQAKLNQIQVSLSVPKGRTNTFGNYAYRSAEDILNAAKVLLETSGCSVTLSDDVTCVADRIYVKSTATIHYGEFGFSVSAFAREPADKKGADQSQVTGSATSYARKYALCGLFAIDDGVDADSANNPGLDDAIAYLSSCSDLNALSYAWNYYKEYFGNDKKFKAAFAKRKKEIENEAQAK